MDVRTVYVIGAGTMGSGLAQACAQSCLNVMLHDTSREALASARDRMTWSVDKFVGSGRLKEDRDTILSRVKIAYSLSDAAGADMVLEAVVEESGLKRELFSKLDRICSPRTIIASNTSAIPITNLASGTRSPERVVGLHFFNPAPMMDVVEVVAGTSTSEETMRRGVEFVRKLGKEPIRVESDLPGFLLNRINLVSYVEAIRLVEQGAGTVGDIDKGMKLAFGRRMGPFETGDLVGLDVSHGALMAIHEESKDLRYYPPLLLRRKVTAGHLGRKTGRGWYEYNEDGTPKEG